MKPKIDLKRIEQNLARRHMADFALYTDPLYQMNWHHAVLCEHLDLFASKKIKRLMVFMPPRHGKSELVSRKLPAFIFGKNPDANIIATSYSADLAQAMNRDAQRIIDSDAYGEVFPNTYLSGKSNRSITLKGNFLRNSDVFEIVDHKGSYRCAGVGGGITGMGGDYIIIDDPIKNREEANSPTYRQKMWDWYASTLYTRLEKDAALLVTLTRWHEDDLAGKLQEAAKIPGGDEWVILSLPAVREEGHSEYDTRSIGEPLWEDKYDLENLARIKTTVGSYEWNALFQQRPAPQEGAMFRREWWQRWGAIPGDLFDYLQSWDCAFKDKSTSDFVVGQVWARSKKNPANRYLLDQVRARMSFTETLQSIRDLSAKWPKATRKLIEDKANGTAVIDTLKTSVPGIVPVEPLGGKVVRAHAVTAVVEAGNVYIPAATIAPWVHDFVEELAAFPSATHDDQVDAMSQANAWYNDKGKFNIRNLV